jgi:hypothetical protein
MEFHHKEASLPNLYNRQKANATTGAGSRFPPLESSRPASTRPTCKVTPATRNSGTCDSTPRLSALAFLFSKPFGGRLYFEQSPPNRYSHFIAFRFDARLLGWGWQSKILRSQSAGFRALKMRPAMPKEISQTNRTALNVDLRPP